MPGWTPPPNGCAGWTGSRPSPACGSAMPTKTSWAPWHARLAQPAGEGRVPGQPRLSPPLPRSRAVLKPKLIVKGSGIDWLSVSAEWEQEGLKLTPADLERLATSTSRFVKLPDAGWVELDSEAVTKAHETMADLGVDGLTPIPLKIGHGADCAPGRRRAAAVCRQPRNARAQAEAERLQGHSRGAASRRGQGGHAALPEGRLRLPVPPHPESGWAASWPTTWVWARPCKPWPGWPGSKPSIRKPPQAGPGHLSRLRSAQLAAGGRALHAPSQGPGACRAARRATTCASRSRSTTSSSPTTPCCGATWRSCRSSPSGRSSWTRPSSSRIQPPRSRQSVKQLKADQRLALTGTPLENRLLDLWSITDFIQPGYLGDQEHFHETYEPRGEGEEAVAAQRIARRRLSAKLRPIMIRRLKQQVAKDLPDRIEERRDCELGEAQRKLYLAELRRSREQITQIVAEKGLGRSKLQVLAALTRLRQICCHPAPAWATTRLGQDRNAVRAPRAACWPKATRCCSSRSSCRCSRSLMASAASARSPLIF